MSGKPPRLLRLSDARFAFTLAFGLRFCLRSRLSNLLGNGVADIRTKIRNIYLSQFWHLLKGNSLGISLVVLF